MAFALKLLIESVGWRWTFRISGFPGIFLGALMMLTVKEPTRTNVVITPAASPTSVSEAYLLLLRSNRQASKVGWVLINQHARFVLCSIVLRMTCTVRGL